MESIDSTNAYDSQPLISIKGRFTFLWITVTCVLVFSLWTMYSEYQKGKIFERITEQGDYGAIRELKMYDVQNLPINAIGGIAGILAIVAVCMWFYRANDNLHRARMQMLTYTPGWAVGWFFIPFVQLVTPFLVALEIGKASSALNEPDGRNNWRSKPAEKLIVMWYIFFLIRLIIPMIGFAMHFEIPKDPADDTFALIMAEKMKSFTLIAVVFNIIEGICLIFWTKKVTQQQEVAMSA